MREYLDRNVLRPWIAVGVVVVLMGVVVLITEVLGRDPLHGFGVASPTDKIITSSVAAVAVVAVLIYAPLGSRKAKNLRERGRRATGRVVSESMFRKHGRRPATVEYSVNSISYRIKRDMRVEEIEALRKATVHLIYDPQKPGDALILSPSIAMLPEK